MIKKYLEKNIYLQKKDKKFFDNHDINIIMGYQEIITFSDNTPNQPNEFKTKNWVGMNDDARGMYNTNS